MKTRILRSGSGILIRRLFAIICATLLVPAGALVSAQDAPAPTVPPVQQARIPSEQLDSLVAPIALYPDSLLSQTLVASTYPLEIIQLQQWLAKNKDLKDKELADAVAKEPWDPSIQALALVPDVVKRLADNIQWTIDLGNAFLAQQSDVMDAIQRMRQKANSNGVLKSNAYQKVETDIIDETKKVIVVEQADPEIVYVPSYNPLYVFGPPFYPYPDIFYPYYPYPWGFVTANAISWGLGWALGTPWWGGWGWDFGWGYNHIHVNRHNYFHRYGYRYGYPYRDNIWRHNPQHRGGAPYRDRAMADRFGGTARGDSLAHRQAGARQQLGRQGWNLPSTRDRAGGFSDRGRIGGRTGAGGIDRARPGGVDRIPGGVDRIPGGVRPGGVDRVRPGGTRPGAGVSGVPSRPGGGERIGGRDVGRTFGGGNRSAFGGSSRGFSGSGARSSSNRGFSSVGGSRMGGGSRGSSAPRGGAGGGRRRP